MPFLSFVIPRSQIGCPRPNSTCAADPNGDPLAQDWLSYKIRLIVQALTLSPLLSKHPRLFPTREL